MRRLPSLLAALPLVLLAACAFPSLSSASTTAVLLPQSDGNYTQFHPKTGAVHYTQVNESLCNGNTNYNTASSVGFRDSYGISVTSVGIGDGAIVSQIDIVPCLSRNETGAGSVTSNVFYRWNGADSANSASSYSPTTTTPVGFATSTFASLSLFKTSTSVLEIGAVLSATTTPSRGLRLSRIATVLTYTLTVPAAPTGLTVTNISNTENDLAWTDNSNNELRFNIYRSQDGGAYSLIATTVTWDIQSYNDTGVTAGHTYTYEVSAYNSAGEAYSSVVQSTVTAPTDITSSTTWQPYYVYLVSGFVPVEANATLTINPGTIVKFKTNSSNSSGLDVYGTLDAQGAPTSSIYFTSWRDDTVGGDTDAASESAPNFGDWQRITLEPGASSTIITYATIRYGGSNNGRTPITLFNNGDDLTLANTEVATGVNQTNAYGVYNPSGTTTITSCNIHGHAFGVEMEGGSVSLASTASHDNAYGIYHSAGTLSATSSDIYANNTDGIFLSNTNFTIASNAIHGNKTYGVDATGLGSINLQNDWWGSWLTSGQNDSGSVTSDSISSNATSTPWHHELGYWSVRNFGLVYDANTLFTDVLNDGIFNWNSATTGMGIIPISSTTVSASSNLIVSDYSVGFLSTTADAVTTIHQQADGVIDTLHFYPDNMAAYQVNFGSAGIDYQKHIATHELGHALGLGHSNPVTGDIMYTPTTSSTVFGAEDIGDYNFLWSTMHWAASRWWPRLYF